MYNKLLSLFLFPLFLCSNSYAQEISFDKKSGNFQSEGKSIALLKSEKVKSIGKSYFVMDPTGVKPLLSYQLQSFEDTFGSQTVYYYTIEAPEQGYKAYRPNFTETMNTFKEVGDHVTKENLLTATGALNETVLKAYFEKNVAANIDYPSRHAAINDSLMKLVNVPADPVDRDKRKAITANEYGKIGQGNVVIGYWELVVGQNTGFNAGKNYEFLIRNINGGIICVSWVELSGAHTYAFKNGMRSQEKWQVLDLVNKNPLDTPLGQQNYAIYLASNLIRMGLL
ncbi:hypothetical protein DBR32_13730 [Taibaiella sp. KBW10]|uniref:hypothetical protein n=1 Tax=Taibaiella sp. KBW10 TaxID=2153357 RepID=UPI000F593A36|nr:hypothetical protein [Taibaiella sp. KBW10]RQO29969.1 hypothetical protein DBR32_13730 [Taibaiella sp. KBW10]